MLEQVNVNFLIFFWPGKAQITQTFAISGRFLGKKSDFSADFFLGPRKPTFRKIRQMAKRVKVYRILNFENSLRQVGKWEGIARLEVVGDGAKVGGADGLGVFGKDAAGVFGLGRFPLGEAGLDFGFGDFEGEGSFVGVDGNGVSVLDNGKGAAFGGFGGDVANNEAVAAAGESAVGDEGDMVAKPFAHDGGGGRQHFSHAGSAFGAFVADDEDVAFLDFVVEDGLEGGFFGVEGFSSAAEVEAFFAADFGDGAGFGEIAVKDDEVSVFFDGVMKAADDFLAGRVVGGVGEVLGECLSGDGEAVAVQQFFV